MTSFRSIVGIDCATQAKKTGMAFGRIHDHRAVIVTCLSGQPSLLPAVLDWMEREGPCLIALDSPLGWPSRLGETLSRHSAGDAVDASSDELFRRVADDVVHERLGKRPLDVGADRIARTLVSALDLLNSIREQTQQPVPVLGRQEWGPGPAVIEVYPAATLLAHNLPSAGYKKNAEASSRAIRSQIASGLARHLDLDGHEDLLEASDDALDACVCVLAGLDFLHRKCLLPDDESIALREGWIWVLDPDQ